MSWIEHYPPKAKIAIRAPIDLVWKVLLDGAAYPVWGKFISSVDGQLGDIGARVQLQTQLGRFNVAPFMRVSCVDAPFGEPSGERIARWEHNHDGKFARLGLIKSHRRHELYQDAGADQTIYKTYETFSGLLWPVMPYRLIDRGFKQQAEDLCRYCEAIS